LPKGTLSVWSEGHTYSLYRRGEETLFLEKAKGVDIELLKMKFKEGYRNLEPHLRAMKRHSVAHTNSGCQ